MWLGHWDTSQSLSEILAWPRRRDGGSGQHEDALGNLIPRYLWGSGGEGGRLWMSPVGSQADMAGAALRPATPCTQGPSGCSWGSG